MALINCSECYNQVSDKAATCPHCGNAIASAGNFAPPLTNKFLLGNPFIRKTLLVIGIIMLILLGISVLAYYLIGPR